MGTELNAFFFVKKQDLDPIFDEVFIKRKEFIYWPKKTKLKTIFLILINGSILKNGTLSLGFYRFFWSTNQMVLI